MKLFKLGFKSNSAIKSININDSVGIPIKDNHFFMVTDKLIPDINKLGPDGVELATINQISNSVHMYHKINPKYITPSGKLFILELSRYWKSYNNIYVNLERSDEKTDRIEINDNKLFVIAQDLSEVVSALGGHESEVVKVTVHKEINRDFNFSTKATQIYYEVKDD